MSTRAGAVARVSFGRLTFVVRTVRAARAVGKQGVLAFDLRKQLWLALSFALHGLLLTMYLLPPEASALSLDRLSADLRRVRYLMPPPAGERACPLPPSVADGPHGGASRARPSVPHARRRVLQMRFGAGASPRRTAAASSSCRIPSCSRAEPEGSRRRSTPHAGATGLPSARRSCRAPSARCCRSRPREWATRTREPYAPSWER